MKAVGSCHLPVKPEVIPEEFAEYRRRHWPLQRPVPKGLRPAVFTAGVSGQLNKSAEAASSGFLDAGFSPSPGQGGNFHRK
jgi:hypothetical protein